MFIRNVFVTLNSHGSFTALTPSDGMMKGNYLLEGAVAAYLHLIRGYERIKKLGIFYLTAFIRALERSLIIRKSLVHRSATDTTS